MEPRDRLCAPTPRPNRRLCLPCQVLQGRAGSDADKRAHALARACETTRMGIPAKHCPGAGTATPAGHSLRKRAGLFRARADRGDGARAWPFEIALHSAAARDETREPLSPPLSPEPRPPPAPLVSVTLGHCYPQTCKPFSAIHDFFHAYLLRTHSQGHTHTHTHTHNQLNTKG